MKKVKPNTKKRPAQADGGGPATSENDEHPPTKKLKKTYTLEDELKSLIEEDKSNAKLWEECSAVVPDGKATFLQRVSER